MSYCQYEYTKKATGEPPNLLHEIRCPWCYRSLWIPKGVVPRDWCDIRPDRRPYVRCKHRGKQITTMPNKLCGSCRGLAEAVFECDIHQKCVTNPIEHNQKIQHCLGCFHDGVGFEEQEHAVNSDRAE